MPSAIRCGNFENDVVGKLAGPNPVHLFCGQDVVRFRDAFVKLVVLAEQVEVEGHRGCWTGSLNVFPVFHCIALQKSSCWLSALLVSFNRFQINLWKLRRQKDPFAIFFALI